MTEEEIRNLKVGDKFTFELVIADDDHRNIETKLTNGCLFGTLSKKGQVLQCATLVKPAPKFEVGDTVRIIPDPLSGRIHGGHYSQQLIDREGVIASIATDDDENTMWLHVDGYSHRWGISPHCLELVKKAVKDKYVLDKDDIVWFITCDKIRVVAQYDKANHPNAEAAARAECDRLNAEWRKQQESAAAESSDVTKGGNEQ